MKKFLGSGVLFLMIFGIILSSCSSDSSNSPVTPSASYQFTCVVNGGGYTNQTITMDKSYIAVYEPMADASACSFMNAANETATVGIQGKSTGTFTADEDKNAVVIMLSNNKVIMGLTAGTIKVTTFGNVGGDVIGTFSGTGLVSKDNGEPVAIQFTNGSFKAKRMM